MPTVNQLRLVEDRGLEVRYLAGAVAGPMEIREADDGTVEFVGYATVYDVWYDVAGGPPYGWREMIAAGACTRTLNADPDVRLLVNHDGLPLARTRARTLSLGQDDRGLLTHAPALDLAGNPTVQEVVSGLRRGDVDEMSFAFRATRQEWNDDYTERIIREVALDIDGSDVSIVTYPANKATVAMVRAAAKIDELRAAQKGMDLATARAVHHQLTRSR